MHRCFNSKRNEFWTSKIDSLRNYTKGLWSSLSTLLRKRRSRNRLFLLQMTPSSSLRTRSTTFDVKPKVQLNLHTRHHLVVISMNFLLSAQTMSSRSYQQLKTNNRRWTLGLHSCLKCTTDVSPFIAAVCNLSMSTGQVPSSLKEAYITPLLKNPNIYKGNIINYRSISNLSVLSKLLECVISKQLAVYRDINGLYPKYQSAYRAAHSTETHCGADTRNRRWQHHLTVAVGPISSF